MKVPVVCAGEILVDVIPREPGSYREGFVFEAHFGGAPANVAVGVARLGVQSAFVGAVGRDPFGDMLVSYLRSEGVFEKWVARKDARTSLAFVIAKEEGEREFFFYRPPWARTADALLSEGDVDWDGVRKARVVHVSGVALSQPPLSNTVLKIMSVAAESGAEVSLDPNFRSDIWLGNVSAARRAMELALKHATIIMLGYDELSPLYGTEDYESVAEKLLSSHPRLKYVAVRLGSKGAYVASKEGDRVFAEAFRVNVIDTTGAGDAWAAGFIVFKLVEKRELKEAVTLSNAVAALKCTRRGATSGMPTRDELRAFLEERGVEAEV